MCSYWSKPVSNDQQRKFKFNWQGQLLNLTFLRQGYI